MRSGRSERLRPASEKAGNAELLSCLILVAPSGMTAEDRDAWLRAAKMTLTGMPGDLLAHGCKVARERCRFASEIVPTIVEETRRSWDSRKQAFRWEQQREANKDAPRLEQKEPDYITAEEFRELMKTLVPGQAA